MIQYGDIMTYEHLHTKVVGIPKKEVFIGRILAKFEKESVINAFGWIPSTTRSNLYIFAHAGSSDGVYTYTGIPDEYKDISLEWGDWPDKEWMLLTSDQLKEWVTPSIQKQFTDGGQCPRCGDPGYWKGLALFCEYHGMYV